MGGFFGATSKRDVVLDVFFGVDYHSHLGTRSGGLVYHDAEDGVQREIHSITNTPFRTRFEDELPDFHGTSGIGCISDTDPQPLLMRSHLGVFALSIVGCINNADIAMVSGTGMEGRDGLAGIVGYVDDGTKLRNCVNWGALTSPLANLTAGCMAAWMVAGASAEGFLM